MRELITYSTLAIAALALAGALIYKAVQTWRYRPYYVNAVDYGLSTKNEDNALQLQAAFDACEKKYPRPCMVWLPDGTYKVSSLIVPEDVTLTWTNGSE